MPERGDNTRKFVFEAADIRGELTHLTRAYQEIRDIHQYPPVVSALLGEFLAAAVLLSTTIKFDGRLVLQAQSEAQIALLMAECNSDLQVRAIARGTDEASSTSFPELLRGGRLAITIEPRVGQRYQGIVSLEGQNLASCIEHYFENSEQLATRLWLASDGHTAAGLLLQQLPAQVTQGAQSRSNQWEHACTLAQTVKAAELLQLADENLLKRLFNQDPVRVFDAEDVTFQCSCSRARCLQVLDSLQHAELEEMLAEDGEISMDCEFCNQLYRFNAADLAVILGRPDIHSYH